MRHALSRTLSVLAALLCALALTAGEAPAAGKAKGPVKVFILSGQSNMEGKAAVTTLDAVIGHPEMGKRYAHLKPGGKWLVRDDVWVTYLDRNNRAQAAPLHGPLSVGFGSPKTARDESGKRVPVQTLGPELGIGLVLGAHYEEQVLLIKACWGGRAVKYSFRPPGAMPTDDQIRKEVAELKKGKRGKDVTFETRKAGYGSDYRKVLSETRRVLDDVGKYFPGYDKQRGFEIAGFVWFQGWNDGVGKGNPDYVEQMAHFIRDLRKDLNVPDLPFVIGELGTDGAEAGGWVAAFRKQQAAIAARDEFQGNVRLAKTAHCWTTGPYDMSEKWAEFRKLAQANEAKANDDPTRVNPGDFFKKNWQQKYKKELAFTSDRRYHYNGSGQCYYEMGRSMGRAMVELLKK